MRINRLKFDNLTMRRSDGVPLFDRVEFEFPMEGTYWVRGETGSGKSSLLKLLAGLREPDEGRYFINDSDVTEMSFEELIPYRRKIGYAFDQGGLISNRTIRQNLMLPFFYHRDMSADEADARVSEYCRAFRLDALKDLRPSQISSGARKAACVARSLILHPELLLLDHPSAGLDPREIRALVALIQHQREKCGLRHVFITGENPDLARGLAEVSTGAIRIEAGHIEMERGVAA